MATKGIQRLVRRDILAMLKSDAALTAADMVAAAEIHGQSPIGEPDWPFIKLGAPQTLRLKAAGVDGATVNLAVHAFSRGRFNAGGQLIETADDHASRIGAAIEAALDGRKRGLEGVGRVAYSIGDMLLAVDGAEPGAFHYSCTVSARVLAYGGPF